MIKEVILMIMMTGGGDKPVDASFIEVPDLAECEERAERAIAVFPKANITYVGHHCVASGVLFEDFLHNPEPTGPKYTYDLTFSGDGARLTAAMAYASLQACKDAGAGNCVIAYQNIQE